MLFKMARHISTSRKIAQFTATSRIAKQTTAIPVKKDRLNGLFTNYKKDENKRKDKSFV